MKEVSQYSLYLSKRRKYLSLLAMILPPEFTRKEFETALRQLEAKHGGLKSPGLHHLYDFPDRSIRAINVIASHRKGSKKYLLKEQFMVLRARQSYLGVI